MNLTPRKVLTVPASMHIGEVLRRMIEERVSCAVVHNAEGQIVGIMTERDVIRKLALLTVDISLARPINTVMTRPVRFAYRNSLLADLRRMHNEHRLRHFPVLASAADGATLENLVGILTMTDIGRAYLDLVADLGWTP